MIFDVSRRNHPWDADSFKVGNPKESNGSVFVAPQPRVFINTPREHIDWVLTSNGNNFSEIFRTESVRYRHCVYGSGRFNDVLHVRCIYPLRDVV